MLCELVRDLYVAVRQLVRAPGFALTAVITLAIGIGATTAIYSFVDGVLIRPLPYPQEQRLVMVCETENQNPSDWCGASPANWVDWRRLSSSIEEMGLARSWPFFWRQGERLQGVAGGIATAGLFQTFSTRPVLGRLFLDLDMEPGSEPVAVVSHDFWSTRLGASPTAVGQAIELDGTLHRVVGVLAEGFAVPDLEYVDVWIPLWPERLSWRGWRGLRSFGLLAPDATLEQARSELEAIRASLEEQFPDSNAGWGLQVDSLHERTVRAVRPALLVFLGAVVALLLIAVANVANLLLVRASGRRQEVAIRLAIGARTHHLARQVLCESLVLAAFGCGLGLLLSWWVVDLLCELAPHWLPRIGEIGIDARVLVFSILVSIAASVLAALLPMLSMIRQRIGEALHSRRGRSDSAGSSRARNLLVMGEVAIACLLLVVAGLLTRSFAALTRWEPGFDPHNLVMLSLLSAAEGEETTAQYQRAVAEVSTLPGVLSVSAGSAVPLSGGDGDQEYLVVGEEAPAPGHRPTVFWYDTLPGYFQTLGLPLHRGRYLDEHDTADNEPVAVINETLAQRHWPAGDAIGKRLHLLMQDLTVEIVGVVGDVQPMRPDQAPKPAIYWPLAQLPRGAVMLVARVDPAVNGVVRMVHDRLEGFDPSLDVGRPVTMADRIDAHLASPRFNMILLGLFALVAASIAAVGIYAVVSFSVSQQRGEIGIRMALGADAAAVLRHIVGRGVLLGAVGALVGLLAGVAIGRLMQSLLIQVAPTDHTTLAIAASLVIGFSALACYLPARRAAALNPLDTLRWE
jgi:putative ABC transport system permease protein